jgi:hypothetical protein
MFKEPVTVSCPLSLESSPYVLILLRHNPCCQEIFLYFLISSIRISLSYIRTIKMYRTIILPVVLYETWSLTLREECRVRAFENKVLRSIFGPSKDELKWECRRLHNKELHAL